MIDAPKPNLGVELPGIAEDTADRSSYNVGNAGYTALSGRMFIKSRFEDIDFETHHISSFYENEKARGTQMVDMDAKGTVIAAIGEEKRIATFGLGGCTAVAVALEQANGTRFGYVQHYNPFNRLLSANMLGEALHSASAKTVSARAVIMTPGEWVQDPATKWGMIAKDDALTKLLTAVARVGMGEKADVQTRPYSESREIGMYGQGTLMIEFGADGSTYILAEVVRVQPQA